MSKENIAEDVVLEDKEAKPESSLPIEVATDVDTFISPINNNNVGPEPQCSILSISTSQDLHCVEEGLCNGGDLSCANSEPCSSGVTCSEVDIDMPLVASRSSTWSQLNDSTGPICRICHCNGDEEELLHPCRCSGSVMHAHQSCLIYWISQSGDSKCELCKYPFRTKKKKTKQFWKWKFPRITPKGWLHVGLFLAFFSMMTTSTTWILWSRCSNSPTAVAERSTSEVKFAYMLNGIFIAIALGGIYFDSMKQIRRYCKKWSAVNQELIIEGYEEETERRGFLRVQKSKKLDQPQGSSSRADLADDGGNSAERRNGDHEEEADPLVVHETWV